MPTLLGKFLPFGATAAEWTAANPVLLRREIGVEVDTGQAKVGDGETEWLDLPYIGSEGGSPSGAAGGVLGGSYPNPTFAVDMATQSELTAHEADTSNVHGIADTSVLATDAEVAAAVAAHVAAGDPHAGYLTAAEGNAAYEAAGAVSTHAGLSDPHPGYLTPAEGNAAYEAAGTAASAVSTHAGLADPHPGYRLESALITAADVAADVATQAELDAKVTDAIADGVTTVAPSQNAVFDALALKAATADVVLKATANAKGDLFTATANDTPTVHTAGSDGQTILFDSAQGDGLKNVSAERIFRFVLDGGGVALTTGAKKAYLASPIDGTITKWRLMADVSGSIVVDMWKDTFANFPPVVGDTITASAKPTLSSAQSAESATLTGWTTSVSAGDVLEVNVDSAATVTRVFLDVFVRPR